MTDIKNIGTFFEDANNDSLNWFHLRMDIAVTETMVQELKSKFDTTRYIYALEGGDEKDGTKSHTHFVVGTTKTPSPTTMNRWIKDITSLTKSSKSTSSVRKSIEKMVTYICKEVAEGRATIFYEGFTKSWVDSCIKHSTKKYDKKKFGDALFAIEREYISKDISFSKFAHAYAKLKLEYGQTLSSTSYINYLLKIRLKNDPDALERWVDTHLEKIDRIISEF